MSAFLAQLNQLRGLKVKYESIDRGYRAGLLALERTMKDRQKKKFLEDCSIDTCMVPRVGDGLKKILKSAGIRAAADITQETHCAAFPRSTTRSKTISSHGGTEDGEEFPLRSHKRDRQGPMSRHSSTSTSR